MRPGYVLRVFVAGGVLFTLAAAGGYFAGRQDTAPGFDADEFVEVERPEADVPEPA